MKVASTEVPPRQVSLAIEVEQDRLDRAMDDAFRRLAVRVDVPGFRRGKAPRSMVERMIGRDRVVEEALDKLLPEVVSEAIEQEKVEPYTRPRVESIEFDPLRLKAVVGLAPKVELGDYRAELKVDPEEAKVGDQQIDEVVQRLRDSYAQWVPVERAVQTGDRVGIDLRATVEVEDKLVMDSKDAEYVVDTAGAQPAPGFAEQLIGLESGAEKSFVLTLAEDYADTAVAGKPTEFNVKLHSVKERQLPALDDEFAQQVGEYTDFAGLRAAIEAQLRTREEERVREAFETSVMNRLVEISTIEFPPQLVDHQAEHMLETFSRSVERQGVQLQQYLRLLGKDQEGFEQEIKAEAETRVRRSLALDAFARAEKIGIEEDQPADDAAGGDSAGGGSEAGEALRETTREQKAMARLMELARGNEQQEKPAVQAETSDTDRQSGEGQAAAPEVEENRDTE